MEQDLQDQHRQNLPEENLEDQPMVTGEKGGVKHVEEEEGDVLGLDDQAMQWQNPEDEEEEESFPI